ncbi:trypsin-like serine protease [Penicillium daleae]|uniref:Trypsin-like serine protease n=1 Tax=Penicillium daleae TaxID=63821 RepID=A0AAD6BYP6_9EURO|nr:trypsin-like serine protease [Penicillium daleae]KAJ5438593.1 trypsin-like serine protease [Penicillium daleae]
MNGNAAKENEYPFAASVMVDSLAMMSLCGGAIIGSNEVVTAAHCVLDTESGSLYDPSEILVGVGHVRRSNQVQLKVESVILHPDYRTSDLANDIAVLKVPDLTQFLESGSLAFGGAPYFISAIPIYPGDIPERTRLTALGWGATLDDTVDSTSDVLRYSERDVGSQNRCRTVLPDYESSEGPQICTDNNLTPGTATCHGDDGSSVVINKEGELLLAGLVSYGTGPGCGATDGIEVYTHVGEYLGFILNATTSFASY